MLVINRTIVTIPMKNKILEFSTPNCNQQHILNILLKTKEMIIKMMEKA
jgi:hypothetical protein